MKGPSEHLDHKKSGKFRVGDVVKLKSGGPWMTVNEVLQRVEDGRIEVDCHCSWFVIDGYDSEDRGRDQYSGPQHHPFPGDSLELREELEEELE